MPKVEYNSVAITSTGNEIVVLDDSTLDISHLVLFISSSSSESAAGFTNGTINFTGSSAYGDENLTKTITHYRNISGTKTKVFEAVVTALDTGEFYLSVTTCTQTTVLRYVAYGS